MKVLLVHNEYRELGGEEKVVEAETRLLRENGVEVEEVRFRSAELEGLLSKARTAWELPHSEKAKRRVAGAIQRFRPDVMHVHNFFPLATPSVFEAAREARVPAVMTLHNYRILCANGLLLRDGKPCELCVDDGPKHAVRYRCYQGSLVGSMALARMIATHHRKRTWHTMVDKFVVLTEFSKSRYAKAGLPAEKFTVKPNFLFSPVVSAELTKNKIPKVIFVGRLSGEKGLATLLAAKAGSTAYELHIVGDGPLAAEVRTAADADQQIIWHGRQGTEEVYRLQRMADLVVFPSECYENFPIVLLEAMAHGKPVLVSRIGGLAEIVEEGRTGEFFVPGDPNSLQRALEKILKDQARLRAMGEAAEARYLERYNAEINFRLLREIYQSVRLAP